MFSKKKDKFMVQLEEMVFNLDRAAIEFGKMDFNTHLDLKAYSDNIKTYESHGDELMHQVISDLNQTFITPIEREDILSLCNAIDDVLDAMEETSAMFEMYSIEYTDEYMAEFVENIQNCDGILRQSMKHIFNSETDPITLIKIKDIYQSMEEIADKCQAVANNFETIIMKNS